MSTDAKPTEREQDAHATDSPDDVVAARDHNRAPHAPDPTVMSTSIQDQAPTAPDSTSQEQAVYQSQSSLEIEQGAGDPGGHKCIRLFRGIECWRWLIGLAVTIVLAICAIIIPISMTKGGHQDTVATVPPKPTSGTPTSELEGNWTEWIQSKSPSTSFVDPVSPQSQALAWMLSDTYTIELAGEPDRVLQRFVLAMLWYSTGSHLPGWLQPTDECDWDSSEHGYDIRCDKYRRVGNINLGLDSLSGQIPAELGLLTNLTSLNFSGNDLLRGTLPTELAALTGLESLLLHWTDLTGSIASSFCDLPKLHRLAIDCDEMVCDCCTTANGDAC